MKKHKSLDLTQRTTFKCNRKCKVFIDKLTTAVLLKHEELMVTEREKVYVLHGRIHVMQIQRIQYKLI